MQKLIVRQDLQLGNQIRAAHILSKNQSIQGPTRGLGIQCFTLFIFNCRICLFDFKYL